jgi:preprotein translocase subunit SecE
MVFVIVMAIFLWVVDGSLVWLVRAMMGRGD